MAERKSAAPEGTPAIIPYLVVKGAAGAIEFYKKAFGAKKKMALQMGDRVGHAEMEVGGGTFMLADEFPDMGAVGPKALKGTPVTMVLQVANVDKAMAKAEAAGATVKMPASDMFYGHRMGQLEDPYGHRWMLQKELEKLTPRELQKRMNAMMAQHAAAAAPAKKGKGK